VDVELDGVVWPVDTGFIVYNERTYPAFTRLLADLGVATQPSTMSFSVRSERTGLEYNGTSLNGLFAQRRNALSPSFYGMIADILRFNRRAPRILENGHADLPLGDYLSAEGYGRRFVADYLTPMGSAVWSLPRARLLDVPTGFFVRFFLNHGFLSVNDRPQWRVVRGGSQRYVAALTHSFRDRIRANHAVRSVRRHADHVEVDGESFDQVVLACHSDQALGVLADPSPAEREILGALPYQANDAVLHTDVSVLPRRRLAWAAWNYLLRGDDDAPATVTYDMNILQTLAAPATFCVTLNDRDTVDPARVIQRLRYHHPVYTVAGVAAQARRAEICGVNRTHYCGAYWGYGFHEDGVKSALVVGARLQSAA
jgi:predicted NAD/FAD-binding protein